MRTLGAVAGVALGLFVLLDSFETIVLPRRVTRRLRLTVAFYRLTWKPYRWLARRVRCPKRREGFIAYYGPCSLLLLFALWAVGLCLAFALMLFANPAGVGGPGKTVSFNDLLYFSGSTFFTLGLGDLRPTTTLTRFLVVAEAGLGFAFLAMVMGYLPVLYQAFSARESDISLLDSRAGSPPVTVYLIIREAGRGWDHLLAEYELWCARLLESHLSYPVLALFRSQHDNQSWLATITTILDATAFTIVGLERASEQQAELTFAIARHAVIDLANTLKTPPRAFPHDRLPAQDLLKLRQILVELGMQIKGDSEMAGELTRLRKMYEPYVHALSTYLLMPVGRWLPDHEKAANWLGSRWEHSQTPFAIHHHRLPDDDT